MNHLQEFPSGVFLHFMDVSTLYINIPHEEGITDIKEALAIHRPPHDLPKSTYISELLKVVLTNNYFDFNVAHSKQLSGTAIGTMFAYANLFMSKLERQYAYTHPHNQSYGKDLLMTFS